MVKCLNKNYKQTRFACLVHSVILYLSVSSLSESKYFRDIWYTSMFICTCVTVRPWGRNGRPDTGAVVRTPSGSQAALSEEELFAMFFIIVDCERVCCCTVLSYLFGLAQFQDLSLSDLAYYTLFALI